MEKDLTACGAPRGLLFADKEVATDSFDVLVCVRPPPGNSPDIELCGYQTFF
jgi:hypothetical protein